MDRPASTHAGSDARARAGRADRACALTKQAVILHYGPAVEGTGAGADGVAWWVESWARCDVAEFPPAVTDDLHYEFWSGADGRRQPIRTVVSFRVRTA